jgi:hypothetical protein
VELWWRRRLAVFLAGVFVLSFLVTFLLAGGWRPPKGNSPARKVETGLPAAPSGLPGAAGTPSAAGTPGAADRTMISPGVRVSSTTRIAYEVKYDRCGCDERREEPPSAFMIGLGLEAVRMAVPDWPIEVFTRELVVFKRTVDGLCPDMARYRHITLLDGEVVLYYGRPPKLRLATRTGITTEQLRSEDLARLIAGITVAREDEAWALLEGLTE